MLRPRSAAWYVRDRPAYVALLRAIDVSGTEKLAMADLRQSCERCGFRGVATYPVWIDERR
jgi:hypothetical protein